MTTMQQLSASQASPEVIVNENFEALSAGAIFAKNHDTSTGLTWGYYGGLYNGNTVANGTVSLTNSADNYVVVLRSTGVVSASTSSTNSTNPAYAKLFKVTCAGSVVTTVVDQRQDANGLFFIPEAASTLGKHAIYIAAGSITPSASGGCAALATVAVGSGQPDLQTLNFDASSAEYAQFSIRMPESWDEGTITFVPIWSHPSTTTNFGVTWKLQAVAISNDDAMATSFGTAQSSTDTGGTTDDIYIGPESSAITVAGTPQAGDMVFFRVSRDPSDGSDTMAVDARMHGLTVYITTSAETDA